MSTALDLVTDLSTLPVGDLLDAAIFVSQANENRGGKGKSANIGFGSAEHVTYFQTPRVYAPFNLDRGEKFESASYDSAKLLLTIKADAKGADALENLCVAMDKAVLKAAFENQLDWFGTAVKDYKSMEVIKDRYYPALSRRDMYEPQIKIKIDDSALIYSKVGLEKNAAAIKVDNSALVANSTVRAIIKFSAWSTGGKFGITLKATQVLVIESGVANKKRSFAAFTTNMIKDDDEEDDKDDKNDKENDDHENDD
jgi:hypothetical protein